MKIKMVIVHMVAVSPVKKGHHGYKRMENTSFYPPVPHV
jgi:hypothetical protein